MNVLRQNSLFKFGRQTFSRFSTSAKLQQNQSPKEKSTVDDQEIFFHSNLKDDWWDVEGDMRGLHAMNPLRVKFVRNGLVNTGFKETNPSRPLEGVKLLDVGCGGGILSEPLARIGANVTGLDASKELIDTAKKHAELDDSLSTNLNYVNMSIEEFSKDNKEAYDAIVASEILEHVIDQELFLKSCSEVLKPKGSIFITTLNRNIVSFLGGIVGAEYILRLVPVGTHNWNKFITPDETRQFLEKYNCKTKLIHGIFYNPAMNSWSWTSSTLINYALHAVKLENK